jgi:hypothetical protein
MLGSSVVAAVAVEAPATPIKISDTEAVVIEKTIRGFYEINHEKLELYDRKKGSTVILRLDKILTSDPDCVKFPKDGYVAICGECTQIEGADKDAKETDKYVVWFLVARGTLPTATVDEMFIKSVNGQQMYTWTKNGDGSWSATVIPDEAPAK